MRFESAPLAQIIGLEQVDGVLAAAATEVLETMFFTLVDDPEQTAGEDDIRAETEPATGAEVLFHGPHGGRFQVALPESGARAIAANFIGVMDPREVTDGQMAQVMCEFANMVCGATLSRLAPREIFHLETPRWCSAPNGTLLSAPGGTWLGAPGGTWLSAPGGARCASALARRLNTGCGWIDLYWRWEVAA